MKITEASGENGKGNALNGLLRTVTSPMRRISERASDAVVVRGHESSPGPQPGLHTQKVHVRGLPPSDTEVVRPAVAAPAASRVTWGRRQAVDERHADGAKDGASLSGTAHEHDRPAGREVEVDRTHSEVQEKYRFRTFVTEGDSKEGSWYELRRTHGNVLVDDAKVVVFAWTNHDGPDQFKAMSDCIASFDLGGKDGVLLVEGLQRGVIADKRDDRYTSLPLNIRIQGWDNPNLVFSNRIIANELIRTAKEAEKARGHASQGQLKELNDRVLAKLAEFNAAAEARDPELFGSVKDVRTSDPDKIIFVGVGQGHIDHPGFVEALREHEFVVLEVAPVDIKKPHTGS